MSKQKLFLIAGVTVSLAQFASASELAYTQNNPPQQHCAMGMMNKENPILINADLLYGRIISQQLPLATKVLATNTTQDIKSYYYDNKNKVGFRVGVGVGLGDNDANLSLQYMRQTSGGNNTISDTQGSVNPISPSWLITPSLENGRTFSPSSGNFTLSNDKRSRLQILDLMVQTAKWMANEMIRFQPFGGARYLHLGSHYKGNFAQNASNSTWSNAIKTQGYGAFIGTDVRFMVYNSFNFFANMLTGILAGSLRSNYNDQNLPIAQPNFSTKNHFELTMNPFWEVRFGFMWSYMFSNKMLLALRLAYEMSSITHETINQVNSGFLNSVIKTQLGSFGATVTF